jgi:light-independent protochlorophyllide reductase subunit B
MERHIAKRLGVPCAVISSPIHVQDVPARYSPQMGFEGANVIFDTWVHPLMMGLEEHLLQMFREDFEFGDGAAPSHLASVHGGAPVRPAVEADVAVLERPEPAVLVADVTEPDLEAIVPEPPVAPTVVTSTIWLPDAERELKKIPFFVRGKAKRNTERYAIEHGLDRISVDTLYEAKAHYAR